MGNIRAWRLRLGCVDAHGVHSCSAARYGHLRRALGLALVIGARGVFPNCGVVAGTLWWTKTGSDRFHDFNTFWEHVGLIGGLMLAAVLAARDRRDMRVE